MSKIESSVIETINVQEAIYSANSIMAWLCIDTPAYRKLREYVVKSLKYDPINSELLVRKSIANKQIKLKDNGIHNQIKEYLDNLPDYHTWFTLIWCLNPKLESEDSEGNSHYPLNAEIENLFNLIKV